MGLRHPAAAELVWGSERVFRLGGWQHSPAHSLGKIPVSFHDAEWMCMSCWGRERVRLTMPTGGHTEVNFSLRTLQVRQKKKMSEELAFSSANPLSTQ